MLTFGYNQGIPDGVSTAWGCRAIFNGGTVDVLHDRQSVMGERAAIDALGEELNAAWRHWQERATEEYTAGNLPEDGTATLVETETMVIKARRAGGYLYVVAYPRTEVTE